MSIFSHHQVHKEQLIEWGIGAGAAQYIYILIIALLFMALNHVMVNSPSLVSFIMMLLLFVFSAAVSGLIVLGYPIYLALHARFKEGLATVGITLTTLAAFFLLTLIFYIIIKA